METGIIFLERPDVVQDGGNGCSDIRLNIREIVMQENENENIVDVKKFSADVIKDVPNPVTLASVVNRAVCIKFSASEREASLRKGIADSSDKDYLIFNDYVEEMKKMCREAGLL